ncbi:MAG: hypothetical protein ACO35Q_02570 [Prochlorothrix sp.]
MTVPSVPEFDKLNLPPSDSPELAAIAEEVRQLSRQSQHDIETTLALLRLLESLHREIRVTTFQRLLPTNRQALYALLREIEGKGGWPYIPRMTLRAFLRTIADAQPANTEQPPPSPNRSEFND